VRLVEPKLDAKPRFFSNIPEPFARREGSYLILPAHHIFGSEELSLLSPGVAERAPKLYLALNPDDAREVGSAEGEEVEIDMGGEVRRLPLRLDSSLPNGIGLMPAGLAGMPRIDLPDWARVNRLPVNDRTEGR
jgi:NADH-quinone oxidoreductase subunit G